jgi:segregation and condensation protein B
MSLKAKLEAVIYAAEEPVTLNQLAVLFADEALEWRAEQEKAAAEAEASLPGPDTEPQPLLTQAFDYLELESGAESGPPVDETPEPGGEPGAEPVMDPAPDAAAETEPDAQAVAEESGAELQVQTPAADENSADETPAEAVAEPPASESLDASLNTSSDTGSDAGPELTPEEVAKQAARQRDREVRLVIRELLDQLVDDYASDGSGIEIREIAGGYRMATKPEYHDAVRSFVKSMKPAMKLSLPALETLAVIAYKQPVTAPEVNEIRGVESSGVFGSLLARKLIATAGRKPVVGRPILYKTTKEFLLRFGLKELNELPSMEEFEKMAASEFEEAEAAGQEQEALAAEDAEQENLREQVTEAATAQDVEETAETETEPQAAPATEEASAESAETTLE